MTTKKPSPIEEHKVADLILGRQELIDVINAESTNATMVKCKIEAIKLLARMHHALQVDKVVAKATATQAQAQTLPPDVKARVDKEINEVLGRGTAVQDTATLPQ